VNDATVGNTGRAGTQWLDPIVISFAQEIVCIQVEVRRMRAS
jgi:hypothetical protein